jgi:putative addiction module component (TIGR02574 family)
MGVEPMSMRDKAIESAAMQMTKSSRARLAEMLLVSLDEEDEIEAAWGEEIERRVAQIDSGEVELIPGEQVMAELHSLLK